MRRVLLATHFACALAGCGEAGNSGDDRDAGADPDRDGGASDAGDASAAVDGAIDLDGGSTGDGAQDGPTWTDPEAVPKLDGTASARTTVGNAMASDSRGRVTLFYQEQASGGPRRLLHTSLEGDEWSTPRPFDPVLGSVGGYNIAVDADDRIHVVWTSVDGQEVWYTAGDPTTASWDEPERISGDVVAQASFPAVTADLNGRIHLVWHDGDDTDAEVMYARSVGGAWDDQQNLSQTPGAASVFPRADLSGASGDDLAFTWREDSGPPDNWDVVMAYSRDGGMTWSTRTVAGGPGAQWDPGVVVDGDGFVHVNYHEYPADRGPATVEYLRLDDVEDPTPAIPLTLSAPGVRSLLTIFAYDRVHDVQWVFWKDERDYVSQEDANSEMAARFSADKGVTWGDLEPLTDLGGVELGFKKCAVGGDGIPHVTYEIPANPAETATIYYRRRTSVPPP